MQKGWVAQRSLVVERGASRTNVPGGSVHEELGWREKGFFLTKKLPLNLGRVETRQRGWSETLVNGKSHGNLRYEYEQKEYGYCKLYREATIHSQSTQLN